MDHSPDFNYDETIISQYYLNPANTTWVRKLGSHAACLSVSMVFIALFLNNNDPAWTVVAYLILAAQMFRTIRGAARWQPAARGMVVKYEAKIAELAAALEKHEKHEKQEKPGPQP